jgi:hypothetical protein
MVITADESWTRGAVEKVFVLRAGLAVLMKPHLKEQNVYTLEHRHSFDGILRELEPGRREPAFSRSLKYAAYQPVAGNTTPSGVAVFAPAQMESCQ